MRNILLTVKYSIYSIAVITLCSCGGGRDDRASQIESTMPQESTSQESINYNIFVENSGSMMGYCNINNKQALETLIGDYYDRIESNLKDNDTITLNFINTSIVNHSKDIKDFKSAIKKQCNAKYSKLDDILSQIMDSLNDNDVNLLISDYVFTTNEGNPEAAKSSIAALFTKKLKKKDFSIAIFKYMRDFKGRYYPGNIACNKPLPIYIWIFGKPNEVKKVAQLPFLTQNCGEYYLQTACTVPFEFNVDTKRMIDHHSIKLSKWDKKTHKEYYELKVIVDLQKIMLDETDILDISQYSLQTRNNSIFTIASIDKAGNGKYEFTIRTKRPSPGTLTISRPMTTAKWIEKSNYTGTGIPTDSTTLNISYLINGVSKAFQDVSSGKANYFEFEVEFKK